MSKTTALLLSLCLAAFSGNAVATDVNAMSNDSFMVADLKKDDSSRPDFERDDFERDRVFFDDDFFFDDDELFFDDDEFFFDDDIFFFRRNPFLLNRLLRRNLRDDD